MRAHVAEFVFHFIGLALQAQHFNAARRPLFYQRLGHRQFAVDQANPLRQPGGGFVQPVAASVVQRRFRLDKFGEFIQFVREDQRFITHFRPQPRRGCQRRVQPRHCFLDVGFRFGAVKLRQRLALFNNIANLDVEMIQNSAFQRLHHLFAPGGFYRAAAGGDFIKLEVPRPAEKTEQHHSGNAYRQRRTRQAGFSQATVVLQLSVHAADPLFLSCNTTRRAVGSLCSRKMASFAPSITIRP